MVSPLVRHRVISRESSETLYALVMGERGTGKTTLASELSKIHPSQSQKLISVEGRDNYYLVNQEKYSFVLIDASGHEDPEALQKLTQSGSIGRQNKVKTVFLVIKYDTRFERMMTSYFSIQESAEKYADKFVVMISHADYSKSPEDDFKEICELFEEECPNIVNFICYSDQHLNGELADLMFSCISNMKSDLLILVEDKSALNDNQNTNEILEDALSKNEGQPLEGNPHQRTASISSTKPHTSHEKSLVVVGISGEVLNVGNEKVETQNSTQGDSSASDLDSRSTKRNKVKNETRIYRARRKGCRWFSCFHR